MKNFSNTAATMDYNNCIWVNDYDRFGNLTTSTPYRNFADAINSTIEAVSTINQYFSERFHYVRKSAFVWENKVGKKMCIERKGDLFLHIADTWVAISAHYDVDMEKVNEMCDNKAFLLQLFGLTLLDNDRLFAYADELYGKVGN